ncbi:MAG TPA: hypothetical protein DDW52_24120 [Planctomycetaceae bacterium]|nr:hypothetical protein [Planctomycetaceae bacterium]
MRNVKFASRIPSKLQMQRATDEGWAGQIRTMQDEIAVAEGCWFDFEKAEAVRDFFEKRLTHGKDAFHNQPFKLAEYQQVEIIDPLYGWYTSDGLRRFRSFFVFIPKKNGKTQLAAGISLVEFHVVPGSRVYIIAVSQSQGFEMYDEAAGMVERSPQLSKYIKVRRSTGRLLWHSRNSLLTVLTKSAVSSEGKNASCLILEEFHAWTDRKLFDSLLYAGAARRNPMLGMITTAGDNMSSMCYSEYERAKMMIAGDDPETSHLAVIYEAEKDSRYDDLDAWKKANPSYGITIPERGILSDIQKAKGNPERIAAIKRYRLNIWTQEGVQWLDESQWSELEVFDEPEGIKFGGLDLARTRDFAAFVTVYLRDDGSIDILPKIYCPAELVRDKEDEDKIPLSAWIAEGWVIATDGGEIDQDRILADVLASQDEERFVEVGYDSYNAKRLSNDLAANGVFVQAVPQTMPFLAYPSAEFERMLSDKRIRHDGNPCLKWMIGNAKAITDSNNNVRPCKKRSSKRIDGLTATIIALQRALSPDGQQAVSDNPTEWVG